ncbi:hypothetical protein PQX77_015669 [Marasmius sp. AFHP31]|nr:hypothetical protein PQX77_015669 [Marasmius sp. AFHP31]
MFEPEVWAAKYGWRSLSTLECYAYYMTWVEVGKRMGIQDIPESPDDFKDWVKDYEIRARYPAQTNHDVAVATIEELIRLLPGGFASKNLARKLSVAVLEDDVRKAMMLEEQPKYLKVSLDIFLRFTAWRIRYFHLPAFKKSSVANPDFPDNPPLMHPEYFQFKPWYKPESKWFFGRWWDELLVLFGRHEDVPSKRYKSGGYRLDTMGPARYEHEHATEVFENWKAAPHLLTYLPFGPYASTEDFLENLWEGRLKKNFGDAYFVVYDKTRLDENQKPQMAGTIAFINSSAEDLSTEIGCIVVFPQFQRTHVTSNAVGLMMHYALDLPKDGGIGCRRVQWMANALNSASVGFAKKMGFELEGIIKWHRVISQSKAVGHNGSAIREGDPRGGHLARDTAMLATYWDVWENGGREMVDERMARTS